MQSPFRASSATKDRSLQLAIQRKPVRVTITISHSLHQSLMDASDYQGRSLSNLSAYLLEMAMATLPNLPRG